MMAVGRPAKYPWETWMDGRWHLALAARDFECTEVGFRSVLSQRASSASYSASKPQGTRTRVGTRRVMGGWAFRFLLPGEKLFDRSPAKDGIDVDIPRITGGAVGRYPWSEWQSGGWYLAVAGEDFECSVASFRNSLSQRSVPGQRYLAAVAIPGGPESPYHESATVVIFRYAPALEDATLIGADEALRHKRRW